MASKNELESQVIALEKKIKELESSGKTVSSSVSSSDETNSILLSELKSVKEENLVLKEELDKIRNSLNGWIEGYKALSKERNELVEELDELTSSSSRSDTVLSAKEISYHYHRRELGDDELFVKKS